jgi:hypothetical protein
MRYSLMYAVDEIKNRKRDEKSAISGYVPQTGIEPVLPLLETGF